MLFFVVRVLAGFRFKEPEMMNGGKVRSDSVEHYGCPFYLENVN